MDATIIIIGNDAQAQQCLIDLLKKEEYNVIAILASEDIFAVLQDGDVSVIIIETHLQDRDGFELIRQTQEISPHTEIIILTGEGTMASAIQAIQLGVYDYLLKPSSEQEILSSVASALDRQNQKMRKRILFEQMEKSIWALKDLYGIGEVVEHHNQGIMLPDGIKADLDRRKLWQGDKEANLTVMQGKLFRVLIENWGQVLSRKELIFLAYDQDVIEPEAVEILRPMISRLRKRLAVFEGGEKWIKTIRGTGYVFEPRLPLERINKNFP
jgi:DNA-binding response OmpR family regulator